MSLYLGLPQWSHPAWPGQLLGMNARPAEHLADYARVFNSVEGNTTFYASPTPETVQRWADAVPDHLRSSFKFPKDLVHLSGVVLLMREVVGATQHRRHETPHAAELDPLYIDLYDHVLRVSEWTESLRDMVTTVFETNLSLQDARLNNVMKKLTGWAAIVAVPTAITGFYGQNVPYPGAGMHWGFVVSSALIAVIVLILYLMFKRRDWL